MKHEESTEAVNRNNTTMNRRSLLKAAGLSGAGLAGAALLAGRMGVLDTVPGAQGLGFTSPSVHADSSITDADILNFALNLEYLEAEFYTVATTGRTIEQTGIGITGTGKQGETTGGHRVHFRREDDDRDWKGDEATGRLHAIAKEIAYDEQQHVILLRQALGSYAIAKPAINLDALGIGFDTFKQFLQLARAFEDTGVSAYGGAAPLFTSKAYLATAVRIALTEALHSSNLRLLIALNHVQTSFVDPLDVLPPPTGTQYFEVDSQALAVVRTTSQVLAIVYGSSGAGTSRGGFFPQGVNGKINTI